MGGRMAWLNGRRIMREQERSLTFKRDTMHIHIHIHHHYQGEDKIVTELQFLNKKIDHFMANTQERFDALLARLNAATNDIAADYKKLLDEVRAGSVSDESLTAAEANIAKLEALGASVENPVPEVPETPETSGGETTEPVV